MSANLDLVHSILACWERGELMPERWSEWADPEIEFVTVGGPEPSSHTGLADAGPPIEAFLDVWEEYRVEAEEYRELDDERVSCSRARAAGARAAASRSSSFGRACSTSVEGGSRDGSTTGTVRSPSPSSAWRSRRAAPHTPPSRAFTWRHGASERRDRAAGERGLQQRGDGPHPRAPPPRFRNRRGPRALPRARRLQGPRRGAPLLRLVPRRDGPDPLRPGPASGRGGSVVAAVRLDARGRSTGIPVEQRLGQVWSFQDGKVIQVRSYLTYREALQAAGVERWGRDVALPPAPRCRAGRGILGRRCLRSPLPLTRWRSRGGCLLPGVTATSYGRRPVRRGRRMGCIAARDRRVRGRGRDQSIHRIVAGCL